MVVSAESLTVTKHVPEPECCEKKLAIRGTVAGVSFLLEAKTENQEETIRELNRSGFRKEGIEEVVGTYNEIFEILVSKGTRGRSSRILRLRQPYD